MDGIIFDVDGTLWDSTDVVANAWNQVVDQRSDVDRQIDGDVLKNEFGKPMDAIMDSLYPSIIGKEREKFCEDLFALENDLVEKESCKNYPGLVETIQALSEDYKVCIVSNCQSGYIEAFLKNTKLGEYITDYTCPGDTGELKASNIRTIMKRNHIEKAIYVGDTQGDADACKEAKVPMIFAAYGFGNVEGEYVSISEMKELLALDLDTVEVK